MKKLVFLSALFIQTLGFEQILNGNFEDVKPNLLANNWGINFSVPLSINTETGESTTDNIWFGSCIPSLCNSTTEASEGNFGFEISNAFNESQKHCNSWRSSIILGQYPRQSRLESWGAPSWKRIY